MEITIGGNQRKKNESFALEPLVLSSQVAPNNEYDDLDKKYGSDIDLKHAFFYERRLWDIYSSKQKNENHSKLMYGYILNLFIQYCCFKGYLFESIKDYLERYKENYDLLLSHNPDFAIWINYTYDIRESYYSYLYYVGIDMTNENVYELNKGQIDTCGSNIDRVISQYAPTFGGQASTLFHYEGNVYKLSKTDDINSPVSAKIIPEGSIYVLHNPYDDKEVRWVLNQLANTDNTLILGIWDLSTSKDIEYKKYLYEQLLKKFSTNPDDCILEKCQEEKDGIYYYYLKINTKNLICKPERGYVSEPKKYHFFSKKDKELIDYALENDLFAKNFTQSEIVGCKYGK